MGFQPYYGTFLISPIPVEFSVGPCSYGCRYCFQSVKTPIEQVSVASVKNFISSMDKENTLQKLLVNRKYPVLMSNKTDPFCHSNIEKSFQIIDILSENGVQIAFQTKGFSNKKYYDRIKDIPISCWYITIPHDNVEIIKHNEPNAPAIADRFDLAERLVSYGHHVSIGVNPCVSEWFDGISDLKKHLDRIKQAGAYGIWADVLNFNKEQKAKLSERKVYSDDFIKKYSLKNMEKESDIFKFFWDTKQFASEKGLETFGGFPLIKSDYWKIYQSIYKKTFPVMQDFFNFCFERKEQYVFFFDEMINVFGDKIIYNLKSGYFKSYIVANSKGLINSFNIPDKITMLDLIKIWYYSDMLSLGFHQYPAWSKIIDTSDDNNLPLCLFDPEGIDSYWCDCA